MAIKDEYEVARLHSQAGFAERLKEEFEGDFRVHFHMAPPFLPLGLDARGRPRKRRFGPWMRPLLRGLAKARGVRGTVLDPFRFTADRRLDRALLAWFEAALDQVEQGYCAATAEACRDILAAPQEIRGYGPVREAAAKKARAKVDPLLSFLR
jgi:indolepyruvate ferredoxin oxidoreductase